MTRAPSAAQIRAAPLTRRRPLDPLCACGICGEIAEEFVLWRECDERDRPIAGDGALVFVGLGHEHCEAVLDAHPRAYERAYGLPGHLPLLCAGCDFRRGMGCSHPALKANGGAGLLVSYHGLSNVIICGQGGCSRGLREDFTACEGRRLRQ